MGVTRIDGLPERRVVTTIADARQVSRERKGSSVKVTGANLAYITSQTGSTYDWSGPLDGAAGSPTYRQARFTITLTSSKAEVPLVDLAATLYYSPTGSGYTEYPVRQYYLDTYTGTGGPELWRQLRVNPGVENGPGESRWTFHVFGKVGSFIAFKLQAVGTDELTISITRTV